MYHQDSLIMVVSYDINHQPSRNTFPANFAGVCGNHLLWNEPQIPWMVHQNRRFLGTPIGKIHFCCTYESEDRSEVVTTDSSNLPWRSMKLTCRHRPTMTYENLPWLAISLKINHLPDTFSMRTQKKDTTCPPSESPKLSLVGGPQVGPHPPPSVRTNCNRQTRKGNINLKFTTK